MKRTLTSLILAASMALPAAASDVRALAEEYVNLPSVQKMMDDMFSPASMGANIGASLPPSLNVTDDQLAAIGALMSAEMTALKPELQNIMIEGAAKNFTAPELEALMAFYQTEAGQSVMAKMQPYMQDTMAQLAPRIQQITQKIQPDLIKILQGN